MTEAKKKPAAKKPAAKKAVAKKPAAKRTTVRKKKAFKLDAYVNSYTGLGSSSRDKAVLASFQRNAKLSEQYLEALYHDNDVAARICDALPEEMMKRGFYIKLPDEEYKDDLDEYLILRKQEQENPEIHGVMMELDKLEAREKFMDAMIWSRVFGGAAIYIGADDGNAQDEPLEENRIQEITFLKSLDMRDIYPWKAYDDPMHPKFGEPELYRILPANNVSFMTTQTFEEAIVHESRIITFQGTRTTPRRATENRGWSESLLQKLEEPLMQFMQAWQATSHLMTDAAQGIFKMSGLIEALSAETPEYVQLRLADADMNRSVARMIAVDAESNEDFRRDTYSFNGIPQILELEMLRLSLAARIPVTILMGQSPAGMNATGESDIRWFYDSVRTAQNYILKPRLERVIQLVMLSKQGPTRGSEPERWSVCFPSPWQMNDFEKAEIDKTKAETKKLIAEAERLENGDMSPDQLEREKTAISKEANGTATQESNDDE